MNLQADVVVVGAGLAGAASAYFLSRRHRLRTVVLEREITPGFHASGRNAAMIRQAVALPDMVSALVEGARFLAQPPADIGAVDRRAGGSLLLVDRERAEAFDRVLPDLAARRVAAAWMDPGDARGLVADLEGATFERALYTLEDGVVDVSGLLLGYLRAAVSAGASVLTGRTVRAIHVRHGAVEAVETDGLRVVAPVVVNAAGAWCSEIAALAGALDVRCRPTRRHLMQTAPLARVGARQPIVWDETHGLYFRPESGGLLLSACDETDHPPGEPASDPAVMEQLASKLARWMPRLADVAIRRTWAGLRTLSPDGRFVIGPDSQVRGFFWCAGLGGHGVTASAAVGRMLAEAVAGAAVAPAHAANRFAATAVG